jgi:regulator of RNase E activity RraA
MPSDVDALLARLSLLDSTAVSDALDGLGLPPGIGELRPAWGRPTVVGTVRTLLLEPDPGDEVGAHLGTSLVAAADPGDVLVVANDGRLDVSCWGGILSLGSVMRGVAGVIAHGACRDIAEAEEHGLPVFSRGATPRTGRGRLRQKSMGEPVVIAGVDVAEGDLLIADDSGVVFVPMTRAVEVLAAAEGIQVREAAIIADVRAGVPIDQAMHDARLAGQQQSTKRRGRDGTTTHSVLAGVPTASISDALDKLGLPGSVHGIGPLHEAQRACGPAYTARYEPVDENGGTVGDFLDDVAPGTVVVIDNDARTDCTVWGGIMTRLAAHRGIAATVVNGVCRDVSAIRNTGYRIWSAGRFMRTGKDRVRLKAVQVPLVIDGVTIRPGDIVCCDEDGVVVVPAERVSEVAGNVERIEQVEGAIVEAVLAGSTLAEARAQQGYHSLQTPEPATPEDPT